MLALVVPVRRHLHYSMSRSAGTLTVCVPDFQKDAAYVLDPFAFVTARINSISLES